MINHDQEEINLRIKALEVAQVMRPHPQYSGLGAQVIPAQYYDLLKEAESIYQWIVKR